jgi:hypothetical protein
MNATPCCNYKFPEHVPGPIYWNPFNRVVQCHNCGQAFDERKPLPKTNIGEQGTEQFTITTRVNGELLREQKIHDPFAHTTITLKGWGHAWRALLHGIRISVVIGGTHGAQRAVMGLDPEKMKEDTNLFLAAMAVSQKAHADAGMAGYYAESKQR